MEARQKSVITEATVGDQKVTEDQENFFVSKREHQLPYSGLQVDI